MIKLRPYQKETVEMTNSSVGDVLIELPTGAGKTYTAKEIAQYEINQGGKVLFVAPRKSLLTQTEDAFSDLKPHIIHGKKKYDPEHNVFVSTLQTASKRELGFNPTMVIIDEAHIGFNGKMKESLMEGLESKIVALSATPYGKDGKPLEGFATHINDYDTKYMIENGYLVPPICFKPVKVNLKKIKITAGDYNEKDLDDHLNNEDNIMQVVNAVKETVKKRNSAIVFCITIKHAQAMSYAFTEAGVPCLPYHSQMSSSDQDEAMRKFKSGEVKMLANPASLAEGFDFPQLDTIVIARPTKSQNRARQQTGRGLRLSPETGKTELYLLDCAGMINNTGYPTDKIIPRKDKQPDEIKDPKCPNCESEGIVRKIVDDVMMRICPNCGWEEEVVEEKGIECEECNRLYVEDIPFVSEDNSLYLKCNCGHNTLISSASGKDELEAIFNKKTVDMIKNRLITMYVKWLLDKFGYKFVFSDEYKMQIDELEGTINDDPEPALAITKENIKEYIVDDWRLVKDEMYFRNQKEIELREYNSELYRLERELKGAYTFVFTIVAYNKIMDFTDEKLFNVKTAKNMEEEINTYEEAEALNTLVAERLKTIYFKEEPLWKMNTYVKWIADYRGFVKKEIKVVDVDAEVRYIKWGSREIKVLDNH